MRRWIGLCALVVVLLARAGQAQTRFEWPTDTVDVTRYTTPEECLAATRRVKIHAQQWGPVWADTLAFTPERATAPLPPAVLETARRCSARFVAETAPLADFAPLMTLYLLAGRDGEAAIIVRRRLAAVAATALRERAAVLDSALEGYVYVPFGDASLESQPIRLAAAESLLVALTRLPDTALSVSDRMQSAFQLMRAAMNAGDTAALRRVGQVFVDMRARLSAADRRSPFYEAWGGMLSYLALNMMHERALLDSLRHSTASYVALKRSYWAQASGERPDALQFPIGETAPAIHGDSWFRGGDTSVARPTKGKLALVVYLDYECRDVSWGCAGDYAALRRLALRYPAVEVTVMARTHGYFSTLAPPTPGEEAGVLRQWWQEYQRLPGALAVTYTSFWRLDAPDSRRIDHAVANETRYSFGRSWKLQPGMAFLVDQDGIILDAVKLGVRDSFGIPDEETHLGQLIDVLLTKRHPVS
jgi:hypothetical protein